jgi:hypothetical protein
MAGILIAGISIQSILFFTKIKRWIHNNVKSNNCRNFNSDNCKKTHSKFGFILMAGILIAGISIESILFFYNNRNCLSIQWHKLQYKYTI